MILSGEKNEEYREIKYYWQTRLGNPYPISAKKFDTVIFSNGYGKHCREIELTHIDINIGIGKPEWGAPKEKVFIIKLGDIISTENINY